MKTSNFERYFEMAVVGVVFFIGFVSLFYSWIDSLFNININAYILTLIALAVTVFIVYLINKFEVFEA